MRNKFLVLVLLHVFLLTVLDALGKSYETESLYMNEFYPEIDTASLMFPEINFS